MLFRIVLLNPAAKVILEVIRTWRPSTLGLPTTATERPKSQSVSARGTSPCLPSAKGSSGQQRPSRRRPVLSVVGLRRSGTMDLVTGARHRARDCTQRLPASAGTWPLDALSVPACRCDFPCHRPYGSLLSCRNAAVPPVVIPGQQILQIARVHVLSLIA